jgi:hypothetical protein
MRNRRISYALGAILLTAIIVVAITDTLDWTAITGVSTQTASATGGGYVLDVRYPTVTRPALATPFDIRIERPGGFEGPVDVAVSWDWLEMWDENGWYPTPSSSWADDDHLVMEFDPPPGDVLVIEFDARIQPAQQHGTDGEVAVLADDQPAAAVRFHTKVLP